MPGCSAPAWRWFPLFRLGSWTRPRGAQSLAAALNHSALNIANSRGAFLGGVVIASGYGTSTAWDAALAAAGLTVAVTSGLIDWRGGRELTGTAG
jgi:predicted MFS family arabinose efflux permease